MRFTLGCTDNAVNNGRFLCASERKPRAERVCQHCKNNQPEDKLRMVFECSAYDHIRADFRDLFIGFLDFNPRMESFFSQSRQDRIANFVWLMEKLRMATHT